MPDRKLLKAYITEYTGKRQKAEIDDLQHDFQAKGELCIPTNETQAAIRTNMEFSVAETKYILKCLNTLKGISEEQFQLSETDEAAEAGREAAEELAAVIAVVETAKSQCKGEKYIIPMTFWEMDAFLSVFELERDMFELWTKTELRKRQKYVDVVTDIDERFKPVYNQCRSAVMPIFARMPSKTGIEETNNEFNFDYESTLTIESELEKDIDIELATTDTESILTCLLRAKEYYEDIGAYDWGGDEKKASYNKSVVMLLQIIAKIEAAKSACVSATYTVHITFWELKKILATLEGETDMMQVQTDAEILSEKKYYDTIEAVFDLLEPVYLARYAAIWPNSNANPKTALQ